MTESERPPTIMPYVAEHTGSKHDSPGAFDTGPSFRIRGARRPDMTRCGEILNDWIDETPWMPRVHSHQDVVRYHADFVYENRDVLVAEREDDEVCGFAARSSDAVITGFYLAPEARQKGLGRRMLNRIKQNNPAGLSLWTFVANLEAQRFYEREGFTEQRRTDGDNEENLPDILYRWQQEGAAT